MKQLLAVIGHPIHHSLSPAMHGAAIEALGLDAAYLAFDVAPEALGDAVRGLRAIGAIGFNVTLPHKETIVAHLDAIDDAARAIGAVNTVVREGARVVGTNTDARGLVRSLEEAGVALAGTRVVIAGAGGAARAAAYGIAQAGARSITIAARRPSQAEAIARDLGGVIDACALDAPRLLEGCDLLVQASSATLHADAGRELAGALPLATMPRGAAVIDLVYRPRVTAVLAAAESHGLRTVDGLGMLVHQGALALERWTGREAPVAIMRAALERALAAR
ncbi:shikimate dehydrogenase [Sandaracinus amylolyticus]|uniref:shikimate dehydrogenase n=1 Tax=Sandaracinus amylolyticus TaxID=927083 RepID=UPI001F1F5F32|nr:shikimate dehydrogenase [Sandaracinus amylolyticus]UJR84742.1 Hypothetical protein I5071_68210 [Sandaracinus amylolyticus]